jgi:hypothetical protein
MHSELLSVACDAVTGRTYCGNGDNTVEVFEYLQWGNLSNRLHTEHAPHSTIDCVRTLPGAPHLLLTASTLDGRVRLHRVQPCRRCVRVCYLFIHVLSVSLASAVTTMALRKCPLRPTRNGY